MNTIQAKSDIQPTVGSLVAKDYRTAAVFKKYGIDFCCNGNRSLEAACDHDSARVAALKSDLDAVSQRATLADSAGIDFASWPLDLLADYVEKKHHRYVASQIPALQAYLDKLCKVHGGRHSELFQIRELFAGCAIELSRHMKKEEGVLFPYIRTMAAADSASGPATPAAFGTVQNPIKAMMHEHDTEGVRFREIATLSNDYTAPEDACGTYRVAYALLQEFEADLHLHIHLENNILFPRAIELEARLQHHAA